MLYLKETREDMETNVVYSAVKIVCEREGGNTLKIQNVRRQEKHLKYLENHQAPNNLQEQEKKDEGRSCA